MYFGEDIVGFKVDTFNDERKAYNFFVSPLGIQSDSIEDDVLKREDSSWDGIWSQVVASRRLLAQATGPRSTLCWRA